MPEAKATIQIQKPAHEVYEAIVNPAKMMEYFISQGSGRMEEGKTVIWRFPEFDADIPVQVGNLKKDKYISFYWDSENGTKLFAEITLSPQADGSTVTGITEKSLMSDEDVDMHWLVGNTEGWSNFMACLKAFLEYGINLRKGAFDFMKQH